MTSFLKSTAGGAAALLLAGNAFALGLGEAAGHPVLGQPLHVEIPLLGSGAEIPAANCFSVRSPMTDVGSEFALQGARIQVVGERGAVRLVVTSPISVREPIVAFAVTAACAYGFAKDYVLLSAMPAEAPMTVPAAAVAESAARPAVAPTVQRPAVAAAVVPQDGLLRVDAAVTLEGLARQKYPLQPKAREKFMRMMMQANPGLKADDSLVAAGTELKLPAGLPQRRFGPYLGESKAGPAAPAAAAQPALPAARSPRAESGGKDKLVLGAAPQRSEAALLAEAERLTGILIEQNKTQDTMLETLAKLESDYGELKKSFTQLQERVVRIEAERLAEQQAQKPLSVDFVQLLLAVLAGGAIGGLALHLYLRSQARRSAAPTSSGEATDTTPVDLPWATAAAGDMTVPRTAEIPKLAAGAAPVEAAQTTPAEAAPAGAVEAEKPFLVDFFPEQASAAAEPQRETVPQNSLDFHKH